MLEDDRILTSRLIAPIIDTDKAASSRTIAPLVCPNQRMSPHASDSGLTRTQG